MFEGVRLGEVFGDVEGCAVWLAVGRHEVECDFKEVCRAFGPSEHSEGRVYHRFIVGCPGLVPVGVHLEVVRYRVVLAWGTVAQSCRSGHAFEKGYG